MVATQFQLFCFNTFAQTPINWQMNQAQALAAQLSPLRSTHSPHSPRKHHAPHLPAPWIQFFGQATKLRHKGGKAEAAAKQGDAVHGNSIIQRQTHWPAHASGKSITCTFILFSRRSVCCRFIPLLSNIYKYKSSTHLSLLNDNNGRTKRTIPSTSVPSTSQRIKNTTTE